MCIICVEIQKGKMKSFEARRNLGEMQTEIGEEHADEVKELIIDESIKELAKELAEYIGASSPEDS